VVPTRGEDDRIRVDEVARAIGEIKAVRAENGPVVHQVVENRDVELSCPVDERPLDLEARVVARERGAAVRVRAEEPLRDPPVVLTSERHPIPLKVMGVDRAPVAGLTSSPS
jgi:hypothetical protein